MLKTANEMHEVAFAAIEIKVKLAVEKAMRVLHESIAPQIEKAALEGKLTVNFYVDADVTIDTVISELQAHGYKVNKSGRTLHIDWMSLR